MPFIWSLVLGTMLQTSFAKTPQARRIVIIGDSLSRGYGVTAAQAYPSLLERKLTAEKINVKIINGSESGATTASGMKRLKWQFRNKPDVVLLALGSNDGLRGFKLEETEQNVTEMIKFCKQKGVKVVLAGLKIPPNFGIQYTKDFSQLFAKLAKEHQLTYIPFLLDQVGGESQLMQADGTHPNAKGHEVIADTVYKYVRPLL